MLFRRESLRRPPPICNKTAESRFALFTSILPVKLNRFNLQTAWFRCGNSVRVQRPQTRGPRLELTVQSQTRVTRLESPNQNQTPVRLSAPISSLSLGRQQAKRLSDVSLATVFKTRPDRARYGRTSQPSSWIARSAKQRLGANSSIGRERKREREKFASLCLGILHRLEKFRLEEFRISDAK